MKSTPCDVIGKIAWKVHGNNYIAVSPYHVFCIKQLLVSSKNWWMSFCYLQQVLILFSIGFCTVPCALTRAKCTKTQTLNICMGRNIDLWTLPIPNCAAGYLSICPFSCQAARQWCALPMPIAWVAIALVHCPCLGGFYTSALLQAWVAIALLHCPCLGGLKYPLTPTPSAQEMHCGGLASSLWRRRPGQVAAPK